MQVWALLLPASTRLLTVSFNALAGAVVLPEGTDTGTDTTLAQSKGTAEADSAVPDSTGEYSHSQTPTLNTACFSLYYSH